MRLQIIGKPHSTRKFSPREFQVAGLYVTGISAKEVATRLLISESAVKFHLQRIYKVLGLHGQGYTGGAARLKLAQWWIGEGRRPASWAEHIAS